jgi:CheY-like chemotaxis protein
MEILTLLFSVLSTALGAFAVYKMLKIEARLGKGSFEFVAEDGKDDELYEQAKEEVIRAGKASTSFLQRRFRIGYGRAAVLIDLLEDNGIVAPANGVVPRAVLVSRPKKYRILLVDDDALLTDLLKAKFEAAGHHVTTFNNANGDFVERVSEVRPHLISLDIVMPGRDGFDALTLLKKDRYTKRIPVFLFTNLSQEEEIKKGLAKGAVDYLLTAELTPDDLVKIYTEYLDNPKAYMQRAHYFIQLARDAR